MPTRVKSWNIELAKLMDWYLEVEAAFQESVFLKIVIEQTVLETLKP
jgi:hypothetical protein